MSRFPPGPTTCKHCGTTTCLPLWRKLTLGPSGTAHCRVCGLKVGVDVAKAVIALIPAFLILVIPVVALVIAPVALVITFVACLDLSAGLYLFCVPLRVDEFSSPEEAAANCVTVAERKRHR